MRKLKQLYIPSGLMSAKGGDWLSIHCYSFVLRVWQYTVILAKPTSPLTEGTPQEDNHRNLDERSWS